tara:strand:- start:546 stop:845 length:300 start_codon:yes stop_codon:yes gene_type:complete
MIVKNFTAAPAFFETYQSLQAEWEYIEDPTYSRSIGSHVCMTCSKFDYSTKASCGSIFSCNWHQKLIFHRQHLTHSCESYQKKQTLVLTKNFNHRSLAA